MKTVEDFGAQGEPPSHPELLDWLATRVRRQRLGREGAAPADRHQRHLPAVVAADRRGCCERDPENRLLARGPRFRLPAEMIRDQALAASGLLVERARRPVACKPYQPPGLWKELTGGGDFVQDHGPRPLSPQPVHVLEADGRAAVDGHLRRPGARDLHGPRDAHQHAAAGARRC